MRNLQRMIGVLAACASLGAAAALAEGQREPEQVPEPRIAETYLSKNRVRVTVEYRNPYSGASGLAMAIPQGDEFSYFAFSSVSNPEVFVKVLGSNDPNYFQFFASGLTTFEYTVWFEGCGQTKKFKKDAYAMVTYADGQGFPIAGCTPWSNEITVTLADGTPLTMVRIPAGTFQMGSPTTERGRNSDETLHSVTLTQDYYIMKYKVTQAQWKAVMGTEPSAACGAYGIGPSYPVYCVSWNMIAGTNGFIEKLNAYLASTGRSWVGKFRLPTEAEWERAARGGTQTRFSFGDALAGDDNCQANAEANPYVWWCYNSGNTLHPVGTKGANPYGLFDMHGNMEEWVWDWYGAYPTGPVTDPTGPATGTNRVIRNGYYYLRLELTRAAVRSSVPSSTIDYRMGFRLAI